MLSATVDLSSGRLALSRSASHKPALPANADLGVLRAEFKWPDLAPALEKRALPDSALDAKVEEFTHAVALGFSITCARAGRAAT